MRASSTSARPASWWACTRSACVAFVACSWRIARWPRAATCCRCWASPPGYHRYFSHHAFKHRGAFQFVLAWLGCAAMQNGPLWWASGHRSTIASRTCPAIRTRLCCAASGTAHIGWVLERQNDHPDLANVKDFTRFPELRLLDRFKWVPTLVTGVVCAAVFGLPGVVWGLGVGTTLAFHAPLFVNSAGHCGARGDSTRSDSSRNNAILGVLVLGEGWHNNHHHAQGLARHGLAVVGDRRDLLRHPRAAGAAPGLGRARAAR